MGFAGEWLTRAFSTTALDSSADAFAISTRDDSDDFGHIAYIHALCNAAGQKKGIEN